MSDKLIRGLAKMAADAGTDASLAYGSNHVNSVASRYRTGAGKRYVSEAIPKVMAAMASDGFLGRLGFKIPPNPQSVTQQHVNTGLPLMPPKAQTGAYEDILGTLTKAKRGAPEAGFENSYWKAMRALKEMRGKSGWQRNINPMAGSPDTPEIRDNLIRTLRTPTEGGAVPMRQLWDLLSRRGGKPAAVGVS